MSGPIRTLLLALENVSGTQGATLYNILFEGEATQEDDFSREILEVQNGTVEGGTLVALNGRESKLTINVPLFYDTTPALLVPFLGQPTSVAQGVGDIAVTNAGSGYTTAPAVTFTGGGGGSGATAVASVSAAQLVTSVLVTNPGSGYTTVPTVVFTGGGGTSAAATAHVAKSHTFLRANAALPPTCSLLVYDNVDWWRIVGAVGNTLKLTGGNNKAPMMQLAFRGPAATHVSAPTIPAIVSAYNPLGFRALEVDVNSTIADAMMYDLSLDNQRNPLYSGRRGASATRQTRGRAKSNFTMDFDYLAYTGSYREKFDNETNLANTIISYQNPAVDAGAGTGAYPGMSIYIPDGIISKATTPTVNSEKTQHIEALANYNGTLTSGMAWVFENAVSAYALT